MTIGNQGQAIHTRAVWFRRQSLWQPLSLKCLLPLFFLCWRQYGRIGQIRISTWMCCPYDISFLPSHLHVLLPTTAVDNHIITPSSWNVLFYLFLSWQTIVKLQTATNSAGHLILLHHTSARHPSTLEPWQMPTSINLCFQDVWPCPMTSPK